MFCQADSSMPSLKSEAEFYRLSYLAGLLTQEQVIAWADDVIPQTDFPQIEVIDVSLTPPGNSRELDSRLSKIPCETDFCQEAMKSLRQVFSLLRMRIRAISFKKVG